MARADPYSELRTSAEEQETDDELRKLMQPSQLLDIEAFSGEPQVQLIPSQALMSLVLYLFFFVAFPLVMVLIKLDWIKEPPGTQGLGILNKALAFLRMHSVHHGAFIPMIQTINAVIFTLCGRHAPASAVFYPLAMTLSQKCDAIAFAACAPKNLEGFFHIFSAQGITNDSFVGAAAWVASSSASRRKTTGRDRLTSWIGTCGRPWGGTAHPVRMLQRPQDQALGQCLQKSFAQRELWPWFWFLYRK